MEGNSLEIQVDYLQKYINQNRELTLIKIYRDNGMTGTNFQRPAFMAMLEDIKSGKINCIVVKDLSRFGRNYVETGNYLENLFPYMGIRFISVNDSYDSMDATAQEKLAISLKNVYHSIYSKDISRKICTSFDIKKKKGFFLGRYAPYGYKKSRENHYILEIEEETAKIVKEIFELRLKGIGVVKIARILNNRGILSQNRRLYERGEIKKGKDSIWSGASVLGILENPIYCGCLVERKTDISYYRGGQKRVIPQEEWNYIKNTHEAIIDKAIFYKVHILIEESRKENLKIKNKNGENVENLWKGLIICGECKRRMLRDGGYDSKDKKSIKYRFVCVKKYLKNNACMSFSIGEAELTNIVFHILNKQILLLVDRKAFWNEKKYKKKSKEYEFNKTFYYKNLFMNMKELESIISTCYQDYKRGLLDREEYVDVQEECERKKEELEKQIEDLKIQEKKKEYKKSDQEFQTMIENKNEIYLNRELCLKLIEKIVVYKGQIHIYFRFQSEIK